MWPFYTWHPLSNDSQVQGTDGRKGDRLSFCHKSTACLCFFPQPFQRIHNRLSGSPAAQEPHDNRGLPFPLHEHVSFNTGVPCVQHHGTHGSVVPGWAWVPPLGGQTPLSEHPTQITST